MTEPPNSEALWRDVDYLDDKDMQYIVERWPYLLPKKDGVGRYAG